MRIASVGPLAATGCHFLNRNWPSQAVAPILAASTKVSVPSPSSSSRSDVTGSIPQTAPPASHVDSRPLPNLASADNGASGGGRGMGSYQPGGRSHRLGRSRRRHSRPGPGKAARRSRSRPGETVEIIAREHGVPVSALMEANHITSARFRPSRRAPGDPALSSGDRGRDAAARADRFVSAGGHRALRPAARRLGRRLPVARRGARRNAQQHRAALRQAGHGALPRPTTSRRTPWCGSASASSFRRCGEQPAPVAPRAEAPVAAPHHGRQRSSRRTARASLRRARRSRQRIRSRPQSRQRHAELPLAGARPRHRRLRPKPNGLQNDGINLAVPEGTPVKAAEDGVVAYAGNELKGYGNLVLIRHANGFVTAYAHASEILVKRGETVKRGQVIANSGADRQRHLAATALRNPQRRDAGRSVAISRAARDSGLSVPCIVHASRPARSCTYCQATRPERAPRVVAHSSASRRSSSPSSGMR